MTLAETCDEVVKLGAAALSKASLRIGWAGMLLRKHDLFRELGFDDEQQYFKAREIGRSTWYRAVAIAERLEHLGKETVIAMNVENARILAKVPEDTIDYPLLVQRAKFEPTKEFARAVQARSIPTGAINARTVELSFELTAEEKREIIRSLKEWQGNNGTLTQALLRVCRYATQKEKVA